MGVVVGEDKPVASALVFVILNNGIFQTARLSDNRSRAITHCHQLTNPARFVIARHQENVTRRVNSLRQLVIEANVRRNFLRETPRQAFKPIFVDSVARAQKHELKIFVL